jgi:hypothetical protein
MAELGASDKSFFSAQVCEHLQQLKRKAHTATYDIEKGNSNFVTRNIILMDNENTRQGWPQQRKREAITKMWMAITTALSFNMLFAEALEGF